MWTFSFRTKALGFYLFRISTSYATWKTIFVASATTFFYYDKNIKWGTRNKFALILLKFGLTNGCAKLLQFFIFSPKQSMLVCWLNFLTCLKRSVSSKIVERSEPLAGLWEVGGSNPPRCYTILIFERYLYNYFYLPILLIFGRWICLVMMVWPLVCLRAALFSFWYAFMFAPPLVIRGHW